jgi:hypothetical protein
LAFSSLSTQQKENLIVVPSISIMNIAFIAYIPTWYSFTPGLLARLRCVAVPGQFGRSPFSWDNYSSYGEWSIGYANFTTAQIMDEVRRSSLVAEQMLNVMRQKLFSYLPSTNFEFVSFTGGSYFRAQPNGYRSALSTVISCASKNAFPCSWASTHTYFANQSSLDAALPMLRLNASMEQKVDNLLLTVQRNPNLEDIYLDFLRRWESIGGGLFFGSMIYKPACTLAGVSCYNDQMFEVPLFDSTTSKYSALVKYSKGIRSSLPFTSADIPDLQPKVFVCNPSCKWGTCFNNSCVCFAGYSGAECSILIKKSYFNDCPENDVGINLNGIDD